MRDREQEELGARVADEAGAALVGARPGRRQDVGPGGRTDEVAAFDGPARGARPVRRRLLVAEEDASACVDVGVGSCLVARCGAVETSDGKIPPDFRG
ncbi:hypothetical protein EAO77_24505 [Streptomyces sp. t39]|nr:hypothetical protein EAO77_24505 [Streptomyces sp. t39]